jgi:hypothetical protein
LLLFSDRDHGLYILRHDEIDAIGATMTTTESGIDRR